MRAIVTGATGFTGGHVARALRSRGYSVVALVRDLEKAEPLRKEGIELVAGNLRNRDDVRRVAGYIVTRQEFVKRRASD